MKRALLAIALLAGGASQLSCHVNDYCLECLANDGGGDATDAAGDAALLDAPPDADMCLTNGQTCPNQMGVCAGGVFQCTNGMDVCSKKPSPEVCDGLDNDCDGVVDNGDPGGGGRCGNGMGTCVQGVNHCVGGAIQCIGAIGPTPEICDGKDNDCDGIIDEGLTNMGTCGTSNVGACKLGTLMCEGGTSVCVGAINPTFEICDGIDNNCNGVIDEGFNLQTDPLNCGACNNVCGAALMDAGHAVWGCTTGTCVITSCQAGYHDNNNNPVDGCEFGPCYSSGPEVCDGIDNDCDGIIDEDLGPPPAICATQGECAGTVATCTGADGYKCFYGATVSTDATHTIIIPETKCDGLDNDCNGTIDDSQPQVSHLDGTPLVPAACNDGKLGQCEGKGVYECNPANLTGPAVCNITMPGASPMPETCNNLDDDCDGVIDNGANTGNLPGQDWISIGDNKQMMKYEAAKPDASATSAGNVTTTTCSQPGVIPWTNVTYPQALAACQAIGASLCSEQQWHRTCSVITPTTYPLAVSGTAGVETEIEAEDYSSIGYATSGGVTRSWAEDYEVGFSGISDMLASPNNGGDPAIGVAAAQSPWLNFQIMFPAAATYHVFVRMFSTANADNTVYVGINALAPPQTPTNTIATTANDAWQWRDAGAFAIPAAGIRNVTIYMATDGVRVDAIVIENGNSTTPGATLNPVGNIWAYATTPSTYQPTVCNGQDYDPGANSTLPTGSLASCYAAVDAADHAFDMSGNVKEWTLAHQPGEDPIRGGASDNDSVGIDCPLNFTLADDSFFFTNVGFRCCR